MKADVASKKPLTWVKVSKSCPVRWLVLSLRERKRLAVGKPKTGCPKKYVVGLGHVDEFDLIEMVRS